jgi:hypothetical protein
LLPPPPEIYWPSDSVSLPDELPYYASFSVSGAGGGDVGVYLGTKAETRKNLESAHALGLFLLTLSLDNKGVRIAPSIISPVANPTGVNELAASN